VNAAVGGALRSVVVVDDKPTALAVVDAFRRQRIGVVTCLILDELRDTMAARPTPLSGMVPLESALQCEPRCDAST
jgi:chromosome segregation ATPase